MSQMMDAVRKANRIFRMYDERVPERIARQAGIMVMPQPFKQQKGAYTVIERQPIILIKEDLPYSMRQIVIGHELGHHYLHRAEVAQCGTFREFNIFDMQNNRMEYEANIFAAQLMLPDDEILEYIYNGFNVEQIARAMKSDINLVALKVSEINTRGYSFSEQEHNAKFLKA